MSSVKPPQIQGATDKKEEDVDKKMDKEQVVAQVHEMDLITPVPVDENQFSRDLAETKEEHTEKLEESHERVKRRITEKQQASLAKARAAKQEKARLAKLNGYDAAKGTPVPDLLAELKQEYEAKFAELNKKLLELQDQKKFRGEEAPLQHQHIVPQHVVKPIPDEVQQEEIAMRPVKTVPSSIPVGHSKPPVSEEQADPDFDTMKRFKRAIELMEFMNEPAQKRAKLNSESMGSKPDASAKSIFF